MKPCPRCNGRLDRTWDIWGERIYCINCGWDYFPPIDPDLLKKGKHRGGHTPTHGQDTFSWKEKNPWTEREKIRRKNVKGSGKI